MNFIYDLRMVIALSVLQVGLWMLPEPAKTEFAELIAPWCKAKGREAEREIEKKERER